MSDYLEALEAARKLHQARKFPLAETSYRELLLIQEHPECLRLLGVLLGQCHRLQESVQCFERVLALAPEYALASDNLGKAHTQLGEHAKAALAFQRACDLVPEKPEFMLHLGGSLSALDELDRAEALYRAVLARLPQSVAAMINLAVILRERQDFSGAISMLENAIEIQPNNAQAHFNLGHLQLLLGQSSKGWQNYRWRPSVTAAKSLNVPLWCGESLQGKTLLLMAEQGLGDTLFAARYFKALKAMGATVVLKCQPALAKLMQMQAGLDEVVTQNSHAVTTAADFVAPVMSLPELLAGASKASMDPIQATLTGSYIDVEVELQQLWQRRVAAVPGLTVGIVWQGNPALNRDYLRSVPLSSFAPLSAIEGVSLISLQKGAGSEQINGNDFPVINIDAQVGGERSFADTAALMMTLDVIVTTCTSVANLAGAMGLPAIVLLQQVPDWRWSSEGKQSHWYPSLRLFRQSERRNWGEVFDRVAVAITTLRDTSLTQV